MIIDGRRGDEGRPGYDNKKQKKKRRNKCRHYNIIIAIHAAEKKRKARFKAFRPKIFFFL